MLQLLQKKKIQLKITPSNALCTNCKNIADSCGVHAALLYDENVRRWRQQDPVACPWHTKKLWCCYAYITNEKKSQLSRAQQKHKYCLSYCKNIICSFAYISLIYLFALVYDVNKFVYDVNKCV